MFLTHLDSADQVSFFVLHLLVPPLVSRGYPLSSFECDMRRIPHLRLCLEQIPIPVMTKKLIHSGKVALRHALKGLDNWQILPL